MRQLLMLGFYCEVYRRQPRCRVYVNDVLLDEFDISHAPCKQVDINNVQLSPSFFGQEYARLKLNTPFLKYIEFDDRGTNKVDIRIEIQNNDNNYANGFMTKCTRVILSHIFLSSKKLLNRMDYLKNNWKFSLKNYHIHNKRDIDTYYLNKKNQIFENFSAEMILNFPGIVQEQKLVEEIRSYCNNWQDLPPWWKCYTSDWWIGSSGYFYLTLKKKLGFWRHEKDRRIGRWKIGRINTLVQELYDKYKQYENQRSINT